jgi:DNA polymerase-3 subunit delta
MAYKKDSGPSIEDVQAELKKKNFKPVYFFSGEEDFLIEETVKLLIQEALDEAAKSFNYDVFHGSEVDVRRVIAIASSYPMMTERRVIVLREVEKLLDKELLLTYLEHPSSTTCFVVIAVKPDFRQTFYKKLKEKSFAVESTPMKEDVIPGWIVKRLKRYEKKISLEAAETILALVGTSLREIQNEIEKLLMFVGDKQTIELDDVRSVVGVSRQYNVFELQNAIAHKDLKRALDIMEHMLEAGQYPVATVAYLTGFFRKVWLLREIMSKRMNDYQLARELRVSSRFIGEYKTAVAKYSAENIEKCFKALLEADEQLK